MSCPPDYQPAIHESHDRTAGAARSEGDFPFGGRVRSAPVGETGRGGSGRSTAGRYPCPPDLVRLGPLELKRLGPPDLKRLGPPACLSRQVRHPRLLCARLLCSARRRGTAAERR